MRVEKRVQSLIDLDEIAEGLAVDASPAVALRFLDSAEATLERLAEMPGMGAPYDSDHPLLVGLRHAPVRGFPNHYLFYFERPSCGIELIRVLHAKRDLDKVLSSRDFT